MEWYKYVCMFLGSAFLANFAPHFVNGISGNRFPTPFAKPHGKGLSSPSLNVVWALVNLLAGFLLIKFATPSVDDNLSVLSIFAGIAAISIPLSIRFSGKEKG